MRKRIDYKKLPGWVGLSLTALATVASIAVLALLKPEYSSGIFFIPLAVVSITSVLFGLPSGLFATVFSSLGIDYFVFPPLHSVFSFSEYDGIRIAVFIVMSILVTFVGAYARTARQRAQEAEARQRFLVEASLLLSESLDYDTTLQKITELVVPEFADSFVIQLLGPSNKIESIKVACREPAKKQLIEEFIRQHTADLASPSLTADAIRTGQSQMISIVTDKWVEDYTHGDTTNMTLKLIGTKSMVVVPLRDHGQSFGAMGFGSFSNRRIYDRDDLIFFEELGRRCSTALLNASLFLEARRAIGARDDFISIASHELKTPLTSLYLHLRLLSRAYQKLSAQLAIDGNGTVAREMAQIERQADRLTILVDQLLDLSRIRVGKMTLEKNLMNLVDVAADVVRQFREGDDSPEIRFVGGPAIHGEWDRDRLEQVVSNLVSNAIKYGNRAPVEVHAEFDPVCRTARLTVKDRGPGIPFEFQSKLFGRFERCPTSGGSGLGLGLYIVRQIVEAHGGRVDVESAPGSGSTFTVHLPLTSNDLSSNAAS